MADTRVQLEAEDWVRQQWMPSKFGQAFYRERVRLSSGGFFDFDAASADRAIVACISTSGSTTISGKNAVGKLLKIRSDMFFLLLARAERRLVILTEADMFESCRKEREGGRVPDAIEFHLADIPQDLRLKLQRARRVASNEVSPRRGT